MDKGHSGGNSGVGRGHPGCTRYNVNKFGVGLMSVIIQTMDMANFIELKKMLVTKQ